ncbi:MAG: ABC transporter permease, partial [Brevibacterium sp.]
TDQMGRDIFSRLIYGARASLLGPVLILAIASVIGVPLGVLMAWKSGWVDAVASRATDMFYAFPGLFFALLVIAVFGRGMTAVTVALGLAFFPTIAKFTRSLAIVERGKPYIEAYRVQGVRGLVICLGRLLPNIAPSVLGYVVVLFGDALMSLAGLSFLGFGAQPPASEWGLMVSEGQISLLQGAWLPTVVPGLAIVLTVVAVNLVGIRIADRIGKAS